MIPIELEFAVFVQYDSANKEKWAELSKKGSLLALPPKGTFISMQENNIRFLVNEIYMVPVSSKNPTGEIKLIQIVFDSSEVLFERMREYDYSLKNGWKCQRLGDNIKAMIINKIL